MGEKFRITAWVGVMIRNWVRVSVKVRVIIKVRDMLKVEVGVGV